MAKRNLRSLNFYQKREDYTETIIIVAGLFFLWGFITSMNGILMPKLEEDFHLSSLETVLLQSAFFGAYFIISLIYYAFSELIRDPIEWIGFRRFIILGLVVSGIGCFMFYPASEYKEYKLFLGALFVLASGITILQIAANPYVALLGKESNDSSRLNMAQAVNSLGTFVAPLTIVLITSVQSPYLALAGSIFFFAFLLGTTDFPQVLTYEKKRKPFGVFKNYQLVLGAIAIFMYVAGEVCIGSNLTKFIHMRHIGNIQESEYGFYTMIYWGGAMVGRLSGAIMLSNLKSSSKSYIIYSVLLVAFVGGWFAQESIFFAVTVLGLIGLNFMIASLSNYIPNKNLGYNAAAIMIMLLLGAFTEGRFALWCVVGIGLFNSIMFPSIFTLAIRGLKEYTTQGSALLVMGIVGGALIPPLQEFLIENESIGIQKSFLLPLICYTYIAFYGLYGYRQNKAY